MNFKIGSLAQPVEQLAFNQLVGRSNRPRPTIFSIIIQIFVSIESLSPLLSDQVIRSRSPGCAP
jgi:hypothetical protein